MATKANMFPITIGDLIITEKVYKELLVVLDPIEAPGNKNILAESVMDLMSAKDVCEDIVCIDATFFNIQRNLYRLLSAVELAEKGGEHGR